MDFVIVSPDLWPYALDTQIKRGAELSADHHLMVSWIRWRRRTLDRPGAPKCIVRVCWKLLSRGPSLRDLQRRPKNFLVAEPLGWMRYALKALDIVGLYWLTHLYNVAWTSGAVPID